MERDPDPRDARIAELEERLAARSAEVQQKNQQLEELALRLQEANRLKTEFLARMSHDLRTPMNAIIGYARILTRRLQGQIEERQYRNLENIQVSADHLLELINDILDLSRIEAGRVEVRYARVDLQELVGQCLRAVAPLARKGVELRARTEGAGHLHTDPDRLRRALMNLLSNATKYTEAGSIVVTVQRRDGQVEIAVADTGAGIPAAELLHIFDAFRQVARKGRTAQEGTGLGLAIVKSSVELLGGRVRAESREGEGTTFALTLPGDGG